MIPALESVNADEYNKKFEAILSGKVQAEPEPLIQYDSAPAPDAQQKEKPEAEPETPPEPPADPPAAPPAEPAAQPQEKPAKPKKNKKHHGKKRETEIEFYSEDGEDNTLDPFAPGSGEIPLKDLEPKSNDSLGSKLKKSLGKIFTTPDGEE